MNTAEGFGWFFICNFLLLSVVISIEPQENWEQDKNYRWMLNSFLCIIGILLLVISQKIKKQPTTEKAGKK